MNDDNIGQGRSGVERRAETRKRGECKGVLAFQGDDAAEFFRDCRERLSEEERAAIEDRSGGDGYTGSTRR